MLRGDCSNFLSFFFSEYGKIYHNYFSAQKQSIKLKKKYDLIIDNTLSIITSNGLRFMMAPTSGKKTCGLLYQKDFSQ